MRTELLKNPRIPSETTSFEPMALLPVWFLGLNENSTMSPLCACYDEDLGQRDQYPQQTYRTYNKRRIVGKLAIRSNGYLTTILRLAAHNNPGTGFRHTWCVLASARLRPASVADRQYKNFILVLVFVPRRTVRGGWDVSWRPSK